MNRILSSFLALALCASLTGGALASKHKGTAMQGTHGARMGMHGCKRGETWVKPYMRGGKKVSGYCRKG